MHLFHNLVGGWGVVFPECNQKDSYSFSFISPSFLFGCVMWPVGTWFPDRGKTCAPCIGNMESQPLNHQGSLFIFFFFDICSPYSPLNYFFFISEVGFPGREHLPLSLGSSCESHGLKLPPLSPVSFLPQLASHTSFSKALMSFYRFLIYRNQLGSTKVNEKENNAFYLEELIYCFLIFQKEDINHPLSSSSTFSKSTRICGIQRKKNHKRKKGMTHRK